MSIYNRVNKWLFFNCLYKNLKRYNFDNTVSDTVHFVKFYGMLLAVVVQKGKKLPGIILGQMASTVAGPSTCHPAHPGGCAHMKVSLL